MFLFRPGTFVSHLLIQDEDAIARISSRTLVTMQVQTHAIDWVVQIDSF